MRIILTTITMIAFCTTAALASDAKAGQAIYDKACKTCHGADGTPNSSVAKMMKVDIRNLGSAEVQAESDADMKTVITVGKGKMKPVKTVSGADADNVVAYVRSLKK
jgi:mono/diheme cytochrome c family protein